MTPVGIDKINLICNFPHRDIFNSAWTLLSELLVCISVIIVVALIEELSEWIRALKYPRRYHDSKSSKKKWLILSEYGQYD